MVALVHLLQATMSRRYDTEAALNLILSDGSEAESDGEPMCPGSNEEFNFNADDQSYLVSTRGTNKIGVQI